MKRIVPTLVILGTALALPDTAHAQLSDRSAGILWNVEHFVYMDKCRFDKPLPERVDSYYVDDCDYGYDQEERNLNVLSAQEKNEPRAKAAFEMHKKSAAFVAKAKAQREALNKQASDAAASYEAFRSDAKSNSEGLWFLYQLDHQQQSYLDNAIAQDDVVGRVSKALATKSFSDKCGTYAQMKKGGMGDFLDDPAETCRLATHRDEILKREVPKLFPKMRAAATKASKEARDAIAGARPVSARRIACAHDASSCGPQEEAVKKTAALIGVSAGASLAADEAAFAAAMKSATSKKRMGAYHDASREAVLAKALRGAGLSYSAMSLYHATDDIKKNDYGIPSNKYRSASVLVKKNGESFCRVYEAVAYADYEGGGRYGQWDADAFDANDDFVVSGCK